MTKKEYFKNKVLDLISQKGFKATTMRDIAAAMNCDVSNIYNYVSSKQSFLENLLFSMNGRFHSRIDDILKSRLSPTRQLEETIRMYVEISASHPREVGVLHNEWRHLRGERLDHFIKEKSKFERKIARIVKSGVKTGDFKDIDIKLYTHLILSSLRLLFILPEVSKNTIHYFSEISNFIMEGIKKET